jgi:hypothetical protein
MLFVFYSTIIYSQAQISKALSTVILHTWSISISYVINIINFGHLLILGNVVYCQTKHLNTENVIWYFKY